MTCPQGHEAIREKGDGAERVLSCPWCGWRLVVKIRKTGKGWKFKTRKSRKVEG